MSAHVGGIASTVRSAGRSRIPTAISATDLAGASRGAAAVSGHAPIGSGPSPREGHGGAGDRAPSVPRPSSWAARTALRATILHPASAGRRRESPGSRRVPRDADARCRPIAPPPGTDSPGPARHACAPSPDRVATPFASRRRTAAQSANDCWKVAGKVLCVTFAMLPTS